MLTHSGGPHKVADVNGSEPKKKKKEGGGGGKERKTYSVCLERCLKKKKKKKLVCTTEIRNHFMYLQWRTKKQVKFINVSRVLATNIK